jgi:hypothetical protein
LDTPETITQADYKAQADSVAIAVGIIVSDTSPINNLTAINQLD